MFKFSITFLLFVNVLQDALSLEPKRLFKRQNLIENKKNIGEGVESWAIVGNVPTPTLGRVRPSNEPDRYRQQIQQSGNGRDDRVRLNKRWVRDGNIDRFGTQQKVHGDGHWEDSRYFSNGGSSHLAEDRIGSRTHGTRDGEGRRYRKDITKQDEALSTVKLQNEELASEFDAHHDNRKYNRYGEYDRYGRGYGRGHDGYGRYGDRRYPEEGYERSEERIIITRQEVSAEEPRY
ncbi:uncharacterized protein [Rhodnius prolixus]